MAEEAKRPKGWIERYQALIAASGATIVFLVSAAALYKDLRAEWWPVVIVNDAVLESRDNRINVLVDNQTNREVHVTEITIYKRGGITRRTDGSVTRGVWHAVTLFPSDQDAVVQSRTRGEVIFKYDDDIASGMRRNIEIEGQEEVTTEEQGILLEMLTDSQVDSIQVYCGVSVSYFSTGPSQQVVDIRKPCTAFKEL